MDGPDIETTAADALPVFDGDQAAAEAVFLGGGDSTPAPMVHEGAVPLIAEDLDTPEQAQTPPPRPLTRQRSGARVIADDGDFPLAEAPALHREKLPAFDPVKVAAGGDEDRLAKSPAVQPSSGLPGEGAMRIGPSMADIATSLLSVRRTASRGGVVTIPLLCAGLAILACCLLLPQADANRQLEWGRLKLQRDLASLQRQADVNDQFLKKVSDDPSLAQRLAERQLCKVPAGTASLQLASNVLSPKATARRAGNRRVVSTLRSSAALNAFTLTAIAPPEPLPPYRVPADLLSRLCLQSGTQLYMIGFGLLLVAGGLVLEVGDRTPSPAAAGEGAKRCRLVTLPSLWKNLISTIPARCSRTSDRSS